MGRLVAGVALGVCLGSGCRGMARVPAPPPSEAFVEIEAHGFGYCALDTSSELHCWGESADYVTLPERIAGVVRGFRISPTQACWVDAGVATCVPDMNGDWFDGHAVVVQPLPGDFAVLDEDGGLHSGADWHFGPGGWTRLSGLHSGICVGTEEGRWECESYSWSSPEDLPGRTYLDIDLPIGDACGVGPDGVRCWGADALDGMQARSYGTVEVAATFFCGEVGGEIGCEYADEHPAEEWRPPSGGVLDLDCNILSCCAVTAAGAIECWGDEQELALQGRAPT